jgi:hypothetical protein
MHSKLGIYSLQFTIKLIARDHSLEAGGLILSSYISACRVAFGGWDLGGSLMIGQNQCNKFRVKR